MMEDIVNGVYVELDCLMDTRLSLMYDVDKNIMRDMMSNDRYHNRYIDQFGYISVRLFRTLYSKRNSNILDNPSPTEIVNLISDYCLEATIAGKGFGEHKPLTIYLNIHPYNLTEENIELLRMGLINSSKMSVKVEILNLPYTEVEPVFLKENIGLAIMYDAMKWIEFNIVNTKLVNYSIPEVTLLTPSLVHRNIIIAKSEMVKFFEDVEKSVSMLVNLIYIPTKMVSVMKH